MPGGPEFARTLFVAAPADEVWRAIVEPEVASRYYLMPLTKIELKEGGEITYGEGDPPPISGEIVEVVPGRKLVHTFVFGDCPDDAPSRVTYEIEPMGEMCKLALTHDGFQDETQTYHDVCGGWPVILSCLKTLLETGSEMPWPKASPQGDGSSE